MALKLSGKEVNAVFNEQIRTRADKLRAQGVVPTLAIIRLGEQPDDLAYVRGAIKRAEKTGVNIRQFTYDRDLPQEELIRTIQMINQDSSIHGVLILRPLPEQINDEAVRNALDPAKDVDGITDCSMAGVYAGTDRGFAPCTAEACIRILDHYSIDPKGKNAVVIGRSLVIGKPAAMMLIRRHATVTVCHTKTHHTDEICRRADLVIAAAGHAGTVTEHYMAPGQILIDVAVNFDKEGHMCGDCDAEAADRIVKAYTPVPGGVGTVTTSVLMEHVVRAAEQMQ